LERIDSYIKIEQEPKPTDGGRPPAYWPASGDLRVENMSARYSTVNYNSCLCGCLSNHHLQDGPKVLQDLSFQIKSGERVGIGVSRVCLRLKQTANTSLVGRTGSGKVILFCSLDVYLY
jgi:ABC-type multidrug transport system fused ATPase/permease subunit